METTRQAWRQPAPRKPDEARPGGAAAKGTSFLARVFEASEDENRFAILRALEADVPRPRVLDLGCYNGAYTVGLGKAARATNLVGVEFVPEHATEARSRGIEVVEADLRQPLPFDEGSFDLIHANQVIEHLRGTDAFLRELRRLCAPGGRVVLSTNNLAGWHNIASLVLGVQPLPAHVSDEVHVGNPLDPRRGLLHADEGQTHLRIFTERSLVELAEYHGLRLVSSHPNGYYPFPPRIARRLVRLDPRHSAFLVVVLEPTK